MSVRKYLGLNFYKIIGQTNRQFKVTPSSPLKGLPTDCNLRKRMLELQLYGTHSQNEIDELRKWI